jgi:HK97 family phage major capsid protein
MLNRAYAVLDVKGFDPVKRTFTGIATSPVPDRVGDEIVTAGIKYRNPMPLMLYHDSKKPVGEARFKRATADGTPFEALISTIDRESGVVKERLDEAIDSLAAKPPLIRGVSIGFRPLADPVYNKATGGFTFPEIEVLELSMVVIPMHQDATIENIKSLDESARAASGTASDPSTANPPGVTGRRVVKARVDTTVKKPIADQIKEFEGTRQAKAAEMVTLMEGAEGETLDAAKGEQYETLEEEVRSIDAHLKRLRTLEEIQKSGAVEVKGANHREAGENRGGNHTVTVKENLPPGIGFARLYKAKAAAFLAMRNGNFVTPDQVAKQMYPHDARLLKHLEVTKAAVPAGVTTVEAWAGALVDPTNLASEFIDHLRPQTILGKFGTDGIPSLHMIPFNVRVVGQNNDGDAYWVGQGKPKPLTALNFSPTTHGFAKVATIGVLSQEVVRFSTPSADMLVRNGLSKAVTRRIDIDFIDPAQAAQANVNPASITNGLTALSPSGTTADAARTDLARLLKEFLDENQNVASLVLIMPNALALSLSLMRNSLGNKEFPDLTMNGGRLEGIPVIASQYAANASGGGNLVIAVNADEIFLSDDGAVTVDVSTEASLEMSDTPTQNGAAGSGATMVSLWQNNLIGYRAER